MGQKQSRYYFCDSLYVPLDRNKHNYKNILIGLKKQYEIEILSRHNLIGEYLLNRELRSEHQILQIIEVRNRTSLISLLINMFELGIYDINNKSNKKYIKRIINEQSSTESFVANVLNTYTRSFWELLGTYFCKDIIGIIYPYLYKDLYESLLC